MPEAGGDPASSLPSGFPIESFGNDGKDGDVGEYLASLKASRRYSPQVVHHETINGRPARFSQPRQPWSAPLAAALGGTGINSLYCHQAAATDLVRQGCNVIVSTPTASGKSLIYNLPVFEEIISNPDASALYLFPLKALAQDQLRAINELAAGLPEALRPAAAIYDGDTNGYRRRKLREMPPRILITNPDMLHLSLLGHHERWAAFFAGLTHVIIDEVHTYRGIFGSHMAWVLRRLARICGFYGSRPRFILSSATIANPEELARNLLGEPAVAVTDTGAPQGRRHFLFLNPQDSSAYAACQLLEAALKRGLRTIVYAQSRKIAELVYVWTRGRLGNLSDKLSPYRAGYLKEERRDIEARLATGELLGAVSTSALELGIDIGALDICILVGYPGTVMTTWQRSGRVGRSCRESLTILVAQEDALDQYFMRHPQNFFQRQVEAAVLNPDNRAIMEHHLLCAAAERPIEITDALVAEPAVRAAVAKMAASGKLLLAADGGRWHGSRKYPHRETNLRGSGHSFIIRTADEQKVLGEIDGIRCLKECHPGAIYLHRGATWLVSRLDLLGREVQVQRARVNYFTRPLGEKQTEIIKTYETRQLPGCRVNFGYLRVTDKVTGFQRRLTAGQKLIATEELELPPAVFETEGLWLEVPAPLQAAVERERLHFMGGIHAVEHGMIGMFPLQVLCDRNDVGGIATPAHPQLPGAAVFIYDGYPGGVGLSRKAFEQIEELVRVTLRTVSECPCELGCPSCVHSPKCGSGNRPMDKKAALLIFSNLLQPGMSPQVATDCCLPADPDTQPCLITDAYIATATPAVNPPARYGVLDLETKYSAAEVGGWHRAERMGVSVAVLYDSREDCCRTYLEGQIAELVVHLQELDLLVGFNIKRFDNRVLSAYTDLDLCGLPTLDILEEIFTRLGYRLSLDGLAEHTLGVKKSASGLQALKWYKEGRFEEIAAYCRRDVEITRDLFLHGLRHGYLLFCNKAGKVVRLPVGFAQWCFRKERGTAMVGNGC